MTAAYRFKGIGWFATIVAVVLGFYLVSLQVAVERKKLDQLNGRIRVAERDIRALETEFDTRANLAQLERWNGDTLALVAPTASQFLGSEAQLASISFNVVPGAEVRTAAMVMPALPLPIEPQASAEPVIAPAVVIEPKAPAPAMIRVAATTAPVREKPVRTAAKPAAPKPAMIQAAAKVETPKPVMIRTAAPAVPLRRAKPQVAMLDRQLLSDSTFGDILSGARREQAKRR